MTYIQEKQINNNQAFNKEDWASAYKNVEKELTNEPLNTTKGGDIDELNAGEIGFITTGIKVLSETKVGDTICDAKNPLKEALPGFKPSKPVVFLWIISCR